MQLDREQRRQFNEQGFLFFPTLFSSDEVSILQTAAAQIMQQSGPHVVRGPDTNAVRVAYGAHLTDETIQRLGRHPRIIGLAEQLLDNQVYIHQSRLNPKVAFQGDLWTWHQDFATWHDRDGLQEPRALMIAVFLEDATELNGPLMVIPGSHRHGLIHEAVDSQEAEGYTLFEISADTISRLAAEGGIQAQTGVAGSVLICHSNIVHGSTTNITPWPRTILFINVAAVDNPPTKFQRAEYHCARDCLGIVPLADDCLQELTRTRS
jgi:ectoine hydroxylase